MADEQVGEYCVTDQWVWVATNKRVPKYRDSGDTITNLHDLSYDEVSAISLKTEEKDNTQRMIGGFTILGGFALSGITWYIGLFAMLLGAGVVIHWYTSDQKSYFEFRGDGLIQQEPEQWKLDSEANSNDAREFLKAVWSHL